MYTILAVTNDEKQLKTIKDTFDSEKYRIVFCDNGITAIEAVKIKPFDLMIITQKMDYIDGGNTLRQIRRVRDSDSCPTIMLMKDMDKNTLENYMSLGIADFVKLPADSKDLRIKAEFVLESWRSHTDNLRDYRDFIERRRFVFEDDEADNISEFIENQLDNDLLAQLKEIMREDGNEE